MPEPILTARQAAERLGVSVTTLYGWLQQSDGGKFYLRGQPFTIDYLQTGPKGQGRIRIDAAEVQRLKEAMRVRTHPPRERKPPTPSRRFPGITVPLGRPDD